MSKDFLINEVWQDVVVVDRSINRTISILRKALGGNAKEPKYIETISKKGYRFIYPVEIIDNKEILNSPITTYKSLDYSNVLKSKSRKSKTAIIIASLVLFIAIILVPFVVSELNSSNKNTATTMLPRVSTFYHTPSSTDVAVDKDGNVYVSNRTAEIRKIFADGSKDESYLVGSTLKNATGLAFDPSGEILYVACRPVNQLGWITKINPDGTDEILASNLNYPGDIVVGLDGNLYITELNGYIKKITPSGIISDYISLPSVNTPMGIAWTPGDTLYVSSAHDGNIYKVIPGSSPIVKYHAHINGLEKYFGCGYLTYLSGNLYATNGNNKIHKISNFGEVTDFAGTGNAGWVDGDLKKSQFNSPNGICASENGNKLYVTEWHRNRVRVIENLSLLN